MTTTTPDTDRHPARAAAAPVDALRASRSRSSSASSRPWPWVSARCTPTTSSTLGRVLPGVSVGGVDLSGLDPDDGGRAAPCRIRRARARATVVLVGPDGRRASIYVETSAVAPMSTGWSPRRWPSAASGNPIDRAIADARTALRGVDHRPRVTFDPDATGGRIVADVAARSGSIGRGRVRRR